MDHVALTIDGSIDHAGPAGAMRWAPPPPVATACPPSAPQLAEPTLPAPTGTPEPTEPIPAVHNGPPPAPQPRRWWQLITAATRKAAR